MSVAATPPASPVDEPVARLMECVAVVRDARGRVLLHDGRLPRATTDLSFALYQGRGVEALLAPVLGARVQLLRRVQYRPSRDEVNARGERVRLANAAFEFELPPGAQVPGEWVSAPHERTEGRLDAWERSALLSAFTPPTALRPAWHRPGWRARTLDWLTTHLARVDLQVAGEPELLRSWQISALYRVPTTAGDVYLKAVPPFFAREARLTDWLSRLDGRAAPPLIATSHDETLFVTRGRGEPLSRAHDAAPLLGVMRHVGELQRETARRADQLMRLGCEDRSLHALETHVDAMFADDDFLRAGPYGLTAAELHAARALLPRLHAAIGVLHRLNLPSVLVHGDLNTGNVVFQGGAHTLIDWTDGAIAHPLLDIMTQSVLPDGAGEELHAAAREAWLEAWTDVAPADQLREALVQAAPLMDLHRAVTYHRVIVPGVEDRTEWDSAAPEHVRAVLRFYSPDA